MRLYRHIHIMGSDEFSAEDIAIQNQFGVRLLKYWVNEQVKTIFSSMKDSDKEVLLQSHGNTACNIIEVG